MTDRKKYVLITGCTPGGIGHALSLEFASKGYHVLSTTRSGAIPFTSDRITGLPLEVDKPASITALLHRVADITGGKLDILVNNAGRNYTVPALDVDFDEVQATFEANVFGVMRMCQAFAPLLIEAQGTIVQIGSLAAVMPYVFGAVYNASKAALHNYSNTLRVELAPLGVKVVTIVTGGVKSNIARTERELPEGSYYLPISAEYQRRLKHSQEVGADTTSYARRVVGHVLGGDGWVSKKRWAWEGNGSWTLWFVQRFLPLGIMDYVFSSMFNLSKLRGTVGPGKKTV